MLLETECGVDSDVWTQGGWDGRAAVLVGCTPHPIRQARRTVQTHALGSACQRSDCWNAVTRVAAVSGFALRPFLRRNQTCEFEHEH